MTMDVSVTIEKNEIVEMSPEEIKQRLINSIIEQICDDISTLIEKDESLHYESTEEDSIIVSGSYYIIQRDVIVDRVMRVANKFGEHADSLLKPILEIL